MSTSPIVALFSCVKASELTVPLLELAFPSQEMRLGSITALTGTVSGLLSAATVTALAGSVKADQRPVISFTLLTLI